MDEQSLVKLYMDLTGASEYRARGVFMYVVRAEGRNAGVANAAFERLEQSEPVAVESARKSGRRVQQESVGRILPALSRPLVAVMAS